MHKPLVFRKFIRDLLCRDDERRASNRVRQQTLKNCEIMSKNCCWVWPEDKKVFPWAEQRS